MQREVELESSDRKEPRPVYAYEKVKNIYE